MWEVIASNRRRSLLLIIGMAVMLVIIGYTAGELMFWGIAHRSHRFGGGYRSYDQSDYAVNYDNGIGGMIGVGLATVIWAGMMIAYFTSAESILMHGTSARELKRDDSPQLFNVVDEMRLASGLEFMPKIYLIDDPAPNAFAVGRKPETSAICVTTGLMYRLNRDELQGVIGHEIGHLKNHDVQFMTLAAVMLGTIVILSVIVRQYFWYGGRVRSRSNSRDGEGQLQIVILVVGLLFAILGPVMAQILYFACSRKREFLADACSAQYTRYPEGLASALEKIAMAHESLSFANEATAPMFIVNPLTAATGEADSVFSSHPPTADRIHVLRSMTGASFAAYEAAYRLAKGGSLIGSQSLTSAPQQTIRAPSDEGPIQTRRDTHDEVRRYHGYMRLHCNCGLDISVPEGYEQDTIRCVRCGSVLTVPGRNARTAVAAESHRHPAGHPGHRAAGARCRGRTSIPPSRITTVGNRSAALAAGPFNSVPHLPLPISPAPPVAEPSPSTDANMKAQALCLLPLMLLTSCTTVAPRTWRAPQADVEHKARTEQEFVAFDPHYKEEKAARIAKIRALYATVRDREANNESTSCSHQILWELKALIMQTADFKPIDQRLADLQFSLDHPDQETAADHQDPQDGSWGKCFSQWYCKLDSSTDPLMKLAHRHQSVEVQPRFLDRINSPETLTAYLTSVSVSDIPRTGVDHLAEFNLSLGNLTRLILRDRPHGYPWDPRLRVALRHLLYRLRNPATGWWGERYVRGGHTVFVDDLSTTFHIVTYLHGNVPDMPRVVDTTLAVKDLDFPVGWLFKGQYWNHNNMDVVALFQAGWPHASPAQKQAMQTEIEKMLHWCLTDSLQPDGSFKPHIADGSLEEGEYYATSFLARIGFFDKKERFWTDRDFPEAASIREKIIAYVLAHQKTGGSGGGYYESTLEDCLNYRPGKE